MGALGILTYNISMDHISTTNPILEHNFIAPDIISYRNLYKKLIFVNLIKYMNG